MRIASFPRLFAAVCASLLISGFTFSVAAQSGSFAPPACPGAKPGSSARPSENEVRATAEAAAANPSVVLAHEPVENFGVARFRLEDYAECAGSNGCYWADLDAQATRAEAALKAELASRKPGERLALVLDIDETSLSSYCEMKREDYGYLGAMWNAWVVSPEASLAIPGTLRLFRDARAAGVAVFFITGRPDEQRAATIANLQTAGYAGWAGLALRVGPEKSMATAAYKASERKKIVDAGYRLLMNVGDQWSDLDNSPQAEINVKLPNPFYYLP